MNPNTLAEDQTCTLLTVDANPISLRLPIGSAIFTLSGEVWITQEGMQDDVVLGPGQRFDVHSRASIVASATKEPASVYVACPADAFASVDDDLLALLPSCTTSARRTLRSDATGDPQTDSKAFR
jgi:hypothetical protein